MASKTLVSLLLVLLLIIAYFLLKDPILNAVKSILGIANQATCGTGEYDCTNSAITTNDKVVYSKTVVTQPNVVSSTGKSVEASTKYFGTLPSASRGGTAIDMIVLHHTGDTKASQTFKTLKDRELSVHYVIDRDGTIYYAVDESMKAYHAGCCKQSEPNCCDAGTNCPICTSDEYYKMNERSIGIEIVNMGCQEYTAEQYASLSALIEDIRSRHPAILLDNSHIIGHFQITKGKWDVSSAFVWSNINLPSHPTTPCQA